MSALISGLAGAIISAVAIWLSEKKQKPARISEDGWMTLRAGWLQKGIIFLGGALTGLIAYILLSGGSTRSDAVEQNRYAMILVAVFGAMTLYMLWSAYGRQVQWRGDRLRVTTIFGSTSVRQLSNVQSVTKSEMRGEYRLKFEDGSKLWLSTHLQGVNELIRLLSKGDL